MIFVKSYIAYMDDKLKDRWKKLVDKIPNKGFGIAINDRLKKASN